MSTFAYKTSTSAGSSFMYSTPLSSTITAVSCRQVLIKKKFLELIDDLSTFNKVNQMLGMSTNKVVVVVDCDGV